MQLIVKRGNVDFGNSFFQAMYNGFYIEFATNVVELEKEEAEGYFTDSVTKSEDFIERMLIATEYEGRKRYFLIGKSAENHVLSNQHKKLHNKVESHIPYITFLAGVAYYYGLKLDETSEKKEVVEIEKHEIEINYFSTMLPIWLLKRRNKFSEMQNEMAQRFLGEHKVEILTMGIEKEITINVKQSKCRTESEVARWAIKKTTKLEDREEAKQFNDFRVIMCDLGGGTDDLCRLGKGLKAPSNRDDLECITDIPYLEHIDKLRREKLLEQFSDLRSLEKFIYENINKPKMERKFKNTGKVVDVTKEIHESLQQYTKVLISKIEEAFPANGDETYKYTYFGGVAAVLKTFIQAEITSRYTEEIMQENHFFPDDARILNLLALEVLSINETSDVK